MNQPNSKIVNVDGSVTLWLQALQDRDDDAASRLWSRYFQRMTQVAARRVGQQQFGDFDEEDVALSAFDAFCRAFQNGHFPELKNRDDLWSLLTVITLRKAKDYERRNSAAKRKATGDQVALSAVGDTQQPPDVEAMMAEECQKLIERLNDPLHVRVALLKLDGLTNEEIAGEIGYTRSTVQRILNVIRGRWSRP